MKKIIRVICICLFVGAAVLFSLSFTTRNVVQDAMKVMFQEQTQWKEQLTSLISEQFAGNPAVKNQVEGIVESVVNSDAIEQQLETYTQIFLNDLVSGKSDGDQMSAAIRSSIQEGLTKVELPQQSIITKDQLSQSIDQILNHIDFESVYEQALLNIRSQLSPSQFALLRVVDWLQSDSTYIGTILILIASLASFFLSGLYKGFRSLSIAAWLSTFIAGAGWLILQWSIQTQSASFLILLTTTAQRLLVWGAILFFIAIVSSVLQHILKYK